ncbi:hypothetical protein SKAU_G00216210 [Synaphobranchus kaupii]|uniref:Uncharacterized protein n=1 Tax=Synaphobranchus kaupii TaxID=118154 RepID=A0A9Q1F9S4_SYNKA|nr:hypothetical protein SKAU_G00216210 [Synaphobranchus kaupii]
MAGVQLIKKLPGAGGVMEREAGALCRERDTDQEPGSHGTEQVQARPALRGRKRPKLKRKLPRHSASICSMLPIFLEAMTHRSSGHCCCQTGPVDLHTCRRLASRIKRTRTKEEYRGPTQTGDAVFFTNYIFTQSLASRELQLPSYTPAACSLDYVQHAPTEGFPAVTCDRTASLRSHAFRPCLYGHTRTAVFRCGHIFPVLFTVTPP